MKDVRQRERMETVEEKGGGEGGKDREEVERREGEKGGGRGGGKDKYKEEKRGERRR